MGSWESLKPRPGTSPSVAPGFFLLLFVCQRSSARPKYHSTEHDFCVSFGWLSRSPFSFLVWRRSRPQSLARRKHQGHYFRSRRKWFRHRNLGGVVGLPMGGSFALELLFFRRPGIAGIHSAIPPRGPRLPRRTRKPRLASLVVGRTRTVCPDCHRWPAILPLSQQS